MPAADSRSRHLAIDVLLVVMVTFWALNYSVIKRAFAEVPAQPFNALRMSIAAVLFVSTLVATAIAVRRGRQVSRILHSDVRATPGEWARLTVLGLIGHFLYQFFFARGINGTSVSNSALIIGATPVIVALGTAVMGHERISAKHWAGAAVSAFGIYLVVGRGAEFGGANLTGDFYMMASVFCWATYSLGAASLVKRHSPLFVTGSTFAIGCVPYVLMSLPAMRAVPWLHLSTYVYASVIGSALLALFASYLIWYTGVQTFGVARTSLYSNLVPVVAMLIARVWLGEPLTPIKGIGAAAVLTGLLLTRLGSRTPPIPLEE